MRRGTRPCSRNAGGAAAGGGRRHCHAHHRGGFARLERAAVRRLARRRGSLRGAAARCGIFALRRGARRGVEPRALRLSLGGAAVGAPPRDSGSFTISSARALWARRRMNPRSSSAVISRWMPDFDRRSSASFISSNEGGTPSVWMRLLMKSSKSSCFFVNMVFALRNLLIWVLFYACSRFVSMGPVDNMFRMRPRMPVGD